MSARHLYRAAAEPGQSAELCLFILGTQYLCLGVVIYVGVWVWVCGIRTRHQAGGVKFEGTGFFP